MKLPTPLLQNAHWQKILYRVVFEADTPAGRVFDIALLWAIVGSVVVVMLDSVSSIHGRYGSWLLILEWAFTLLFTAEYLLRLLCAPRPGRYACSLFGIIDLLTILPSFISLLLPASQYLLNVRILRLFRIFRVLKLSRHLAEGHLLWDAIKTSRRKITVFIVAILILTILLGTLMYLIEGEKNGYTSIPMSMYWAVVTLTTVGYGDISPKTPVGQGIASLVMILGYGILAVPTGIFSVELSRAFGKNPGARTCGQCFEEGHDANARYCKRCGHELPSTAAGFQ